jgi:tetratricopeptide (TPR) repeat protein
LDLSEKLRAVLRPGAQSAAAGTTSLAPLERTPASSVGGLPGELAPDLPLQRVETTRGFVYLSEESWPLDCRHGRLRLRDGLALDGPAMSRLAPGLGAPDLARAAFVDVETTGLAGGTGTYVFLVGLGTVEDGSFRLRQFFLAHLGGEVAMLAAVSEVLASRRAIVSFNGRRFDLPLLETRFTLSRVSPVALGLPHLDLLYPARRLFRRRLSSCRLASLEEALLGVQRGDDLPSWVIPSLYFDYIRAGRTDLLSAIFRHNALDILSLVALLAHLGRLTCGEPPADPDDCFALARWDDSVGRLADAVPLYETALGCSSEEDARSVSLRRLARLYRRLGRWDDLAGVMREEACGDRPSSHRLEALVELAKLEEHHRRDYAAAEALTQRALALAELMALRGRAPALPALSREALQHRLWRLRRRLAVRRAALRRGRT